MLRIDELKIYEDLNKDEVIKRALKKYHISNADFISAKIIKKSIDSRNKKDVHYSYAIDIEVKNEKHYPKIKKLQPKEKEVIEVNRNSSYSPVIIGSGPAGLFCAITLIENGIKPIIIERGSAVEKRVEAVRMYRESGILNPNCNVQFGEGGAGTFSDGKLATGINSKYVSKVLDTFYRFGAPEEITYLNKPHIGTDNLVNVLINIRKYIEANGGKYYFDTCFKTFNVKDELIEVVTDKGNFVTDSLVLAIGHSARDVFVNLKDKGVKMARKNFSVGVRIEHLQKMINESQYGTYTKLALPAADYKLVAHIGDRTVYSFCMCPGGYVMASSSEEGHIVTNGMSEFKRDGLNANAALLVNVNTDDFDGDDVLSGMYFQESLEKKAFVMGGSNNYAPIQKVGDYHLNKVSETLGKVIPTYKPGYKFVDLNELFPEFINHTLKEGLKYFDNKIKGFNSDDAIMSAVESRSSSPVVINRNDNFHMEDCKVYPCGEGCGYAGGITSAAVDGIKVALAILKDCD